MLGVLVADLGDEFAVFHLNVNVQIASPHSFLPYHVSDFAREAQQRRLLGVESCSVEMRISHYTTLHEKKKATHMSAMDNERDISGKFDVSPFEEPGEGGLGEAMSWKVGYFV